MGRFKTLEEMVLATAEAVRPPERLTVAEAAEKYRYINNPGSYVGQFRNSVTPYLVEPMEVLTSLDFTGMVFVGPAQCGKDLDLNTPVPTPNGERRFGDLRAGDYVFGADGQPTRVLALSSVRTPRAFEVEFDDGARVVASDTHEWAVCDTWADDPLGLKTRTTEWMSSRFKVETKTGRRFRFSVPLAGPLVFPERELPIDPYTLGVWLGDGHTQSGALTLGARDAGEIAARIPGAVYRGLASASTCHRYTVDGLAAALRLLELRGQPKQIPMPYLSASVGQRRELLRGLMDTDGTLDVRNGRCEWAQSNEVLAEQVHDLLTGLGHKVHVAARVPKFQNGVGKKSWRATFTAQDASEVFSLRRHIAAREAFSQTRDTRPTHTGRRFIRNIVEVAPRPMRCIAVDAPDNLYLCTTSCIPTHNSDMSLNWLTHTVVADPADYMHIDKSQGSARDFYQRRIEKLFRDTEEVGKRLRPGKHNSSTYSTKFTSGMLFTLSWPTVNELSGKPVGRLWLADYDRMDEDVGGEGSPYDLASQRMKSFRARGMCAAESSPSRVIENPRWMSKTPHEAPPTTGILALYNRGDRRRYYWPCVSCGKPFEPDFDLFKWPDCEDPLEAAEQAVMECPHCSHQYRESHEDESRTPGKRTMNRRGFWLKDGQQFDSETGEIIGEGARSRIASFWLKGPAAAFADWSDMVLKFLKATAEFEATGSEEALKTTINTDQGKPYLPAGIEAERLPEELKARAQSRLGEKVVPEGVRFLIASVDVQKRRFEAQVHGIMPHGDVVVIDRFKIRKSARVDEDGDPLPLNPGSYVEDWHLLTEQVLLARYELADGSGRKMQVRMMAVDSGGSEGVTANAYEYWRQLRNDPEGRNFHRRVQLLKGVAVPSAPLVRIEYPNAERKDRKASARGEVPVLLIQTNIAKDMVNNMLGRTDPGGGMVFFPAWLPDWWYVELTAESRTGKGWVNPGNQRNEAFDLLVYCMALCHSSRVRLPHMDWEDPPAWAAEWDANDLVSLDVNFRFQSPPKGDNNLRTLAEKLG